MNRFSTTIIKLGIAAVLLLISGVIIYNANANNTALTTATRADIVSNVSVTPTGNKQPTGAPNNKAPGLCKSISVSLEKGGEIAVASLEDDNVLPRIPDPGEEITLDSAGGEGSQFTVYWIRPIDSPDEYNEIEKMYTLESGCSYYILNPDGQPPSAQATYTMPNWKDGKLRRNDTWGKQACKDIPINFDEGVIFGVNYVQGGVDWNTNLWCRNAGPDLNAGLMHLGVDPTGKTCDAACVIYTALPTTPTVAPTGTTLPTTGSPAPTTSPQVTPKLNACAYTECDDLTSPCNDGLICVAAINGRHYCSKPEFENACYTNPSEASCCTAPTNAPEPSPLPTATLVPTETPTPTLTLTPTQTPTPTLSPTPTNTPTPLPTLTPLPPVYVQGPPRITYIVQQQPQRVQPTYTPQPPQPTYTTIPTFTPYPTMATQATQTPVPPPPVSGNPVPFIIAGVPVLMLILGMIL